MIALIFCISSSDTLASVSTAGTSEKVEIMDGTGNDVSNCLEELNGLDDDFVTRKKRPEAKFELQQNSKENVSSI